MTFRSRLTFLEKKVAPDDDLSHLTDQELLEQLWELFRISKARHGEEVTEAEDQLFRIDPEQALVDSERWTLEHWGDSDPDAKEEYRREVEAKAASLETSRYVESVRRRIMDEYDQFMARKSLSAKQQ